MSIPRQSGFTLIELVVALAIGSILLGVAVPSFVSVMRDAKLGRVVEPARRALMSARSEAIKSASNVTVCPRASDTACGTDWNNGLLVFVDGSVAANEATAVRDEDDPVVAVMEPHGTDNRLVVFASNDRTAAGKYAPSFIRYDARGRADWQNGTLVACDARGEAHSRAINVTLTGSIQDARHDSDSDVPRDIFGSPIDCS